MGTLQQGSDDFKVAQRGPVQSLFAAILCQAIRDLSSKHVKLRRDAIIFLLSPSAEKYLAYLDVDNDVLTRAVTMHSSPDEIDRFAGELPDSHVTTLVSAAPGSGEENPEQLFLELSLAASQSNESPLAEGVTR